MISHVTFAVLSSTELHSDETRDFFAELGMFEVDPSEDILELGWNVRWFKHHRSPTVIHLVVAEGGYAPDWGLSHICVDVGWRRFEALRLMSVGRGWMEHDRGLLPGDPLCRFWLAGPCGVRVEVRPSRPPSARRRG